MKPIGLFGKRPKRFWTQEDYHKTLAEQLRLGPRSLERLAEFSVGTEDQFKLEFLFCTDVRRKAIKLAGDLEELGCQVEQQQSAVDGGLTIITGRTPPLTMTTAVLQAWTQRMCRLGFERDCRFDGWGTT